MRHEIEERRSKALRREEEGHGRKGDLRIDLDSGVVVIIAPPATKPAASESEAEAESADDDTAEADPESTDRS